MIEVGGIVDLFSSASSLWPMRHLSVLLLVLSIGGLWVGGPAEGFLGLFLKFFIPCLLLGVVCWLVLVFIVGCICRWLICLLLVVGCQLSVVECWPLVGCRWRWLLCWFLVVGCRLTVVGCWFSVPVLLIFCACCRAVLLLLMPSSVYSCGEQYSFIQTKFSLLDLENTDVFKKYSTV